MMACKSSAAIRCQEMGDPTVQMGMYVLGHQAKRPHAGQAIPEASTTFHTIYWAMIATDIGIEHCKKHLSNAWGLSFSAKLQSTSTDKTSHAAQQLLLTAIL